MKRGVIIIATTSPYYGRMAYNLAATIKAYNDLDVTIVCDAAAVSHLTTEHMKVFDKMLVTDKKGVELKLQLPKLSPYQYTLYMDADMVVTSPRLTELFDRLKGTHFTSTNEGYYDIDSKSDCSNDKYLWWADINNTIRAYKLKGRIYKLRSEFMYFEKSSIGKKIFALAEKINADPLVKVRSFGHGLPDEFSIQIACSLLGINPHENKWQPAWWPFLHQSIPVDVYKLRDNYYAMSLGGNGNYNDSVRYLYQMYTDYSTRQLGLPAPFSLVSKKQILPERKEL